MTTTYSAFFSSGLLLPHSLYSKARTPPGSPSLLPSSPGTVPSSPGVTRSSSPMPIADDSDVEDLDITMDADSNPAPTPTCLGSGRRSRSASVASIVHGQRPRLRRRRSSLNVSTSPINAIKSPQRNAGNALHLQQRLPAPLPMNSVGRGRSDSYSRLGLGTPSTAECSDSPNVASQTTSLLGRIRSGSVGGTTISGLFRPRRPVRRLVSVPAPVPPPTAPLPALPAEATRHIKSNSLFHNSSAFSKTIFQEVATSHPSLNQHSDISVAVSRPKGRDRAYSCTKGVTVDTPIDEDIKEN